MVTSTIKNVNNFFLIKNRYFAFISVSLCKFLYGFFTSAIGSLIVPIGRTFNIDLSRQSTIFLFSNLGQIIIIFFVGYFADKLGKKIVHIIVLIFIALTALFFNYINNFSVFLTFFFFLGIFGISINTISDAAVSDFFENNKGYYLNLAHVFFGLGALTAPLIYNFALKYTGDFRNTYFIFFIFSVLVLILVFISYYPAIDQEKIRPKVIPELLKNKDFLIINIYMMLVGGIMLSVSGWIPTLFQKNLNVSANLSNYALSFYWLSIVIGRIIVALLSRRYKEISLLKILNFIIFFLLAISFFSNNYLYLLIDYFMFGLFIGGVIPLIISYSAVIYPKYSNSRIAVLFSFTALGFLVLPTTVGILGEYFLIYKVISFTSIVFFIYTFIFYRKLNRNATKYSGGSK